MAVSLGPAVAASAHNDPCHPAHTCPSDHHSYLWNGLRCTSYAGERRPGDVLRRVVLGRVYWCSHRTVAPVPEPPQRRVRGAAMPDRRLTPGAVLTTSAATVCRPGYASSVRNVPERERRAVYVRYGITPRPYAYEVDHLISLELGGSNALANLWPEPFAGGLGARVKDGLEDRLHALVCSGVLPLRRAQLLIARNWTSAYRLYG